MDKPYFYKGKDGELKRYFYCCMCGAGPFTDEDVRKNKLIHRGSKNTPVDLCKNCDFMKFPPKKEKKKK